MTGLKRKNIDENNWQRRRVLKAMLTALLAAGVCGWALYRLLFPDTGVRYNDFAIDSAIAWLENADRGNFSACEKNIGGGNGWFEWFARDRESLGALKTRKLYSRRELPGAKGMKRYELKFDSAFSRILHPKSRVTERVEIEADGKKQFRVLLADYWMSRVLMPSFRTPSETDKQRIIKAAAEVLQKIDAGDLAFFNRTYAEQARQPDYFGMNEFLIRKIRNPARTMKLFEIMSKGSPSPPQLAEVKLFVLPGRTGIECGSARYGFSAENAGQKGNYILQVLIMRDLYRDKSAAWKFYDFGWARERKK